MKELNPLQADFLARMYYGLPEKQRPKGRGHGIPKTRNTLIHHGLIEDGRLTPEGLRLLAKFCFGPVRMKRLRARGTTR